VHGPVAPLNSHKDGAELLILGAASDHRDQSRRVVIGGLSARCADMFLAMDTEPGL
jgi:hypothetical protein